MKNPSPGRTGPPSVAPRPLVLVGSDALAARLVEELAGLEARLPVTVIVSDRDGPFVARMNRFGADVRTGSGRDKATLVAADVERARALALLEDDDVANLHAALAAREVNPTLRLVLRIFDERLAERVQGLFGPDCVALSSSLIAAPSFVDAALGDGYQVLNVAGATVHAGPPETVADPPLVVLAVADPSAPDGTALLPDVDEPAAVGTDNDPTADVEGEPSTRSTPGTPHDGGSDVRAAGTFVLGHPPTVAELVARRSRRRLRLPRMRLRWPPWPRGVARWASARLRWTLGGLTGLVVGGTVVFERGLGMDWLTAFYSMVSVVTTGAPEQADMSSPAVMVFTAGSMLAGVVLIALVTAFAVDDLVTSRLTGRIGASVGKLSGHVVVCGLGTIGLRMVEQLRTAGVPVVGIDRAPDDLVRATAKRLRIPVIRGDAGEESTLRAARAHRAQSVVAATDDDVANVEVGLAVWALDQRIRLVLRLFDQDLSDRITGALPQAVSLSVSAAAAPVFLAAMLGREVRAAVGPGRRVLLVAEVPVGAGSAADGAPLDGFDRAGAVRVFGRLRPGTPDGPAVLRRNPPRETVADAGDLLLVVATWAGLAETLLRTGADGAAPEPTDGSGAAGRPRRPWSPRVRRARRGPVAVMTPLLRWPGAHAILGRQQGVTPEVRYPPGAEDGEEGDAR